MAGVCAGPAVHADRILFGWQSVPDQQETVAEQILRSVQDGQRPLGSCGSLAAARPVSAGRNSSGFRLQYGRVRHSLARWLERVVPTPELTVEHGIFQQLSSSLVSACLKGACVGAFAGTISTLVANQMPAFRTGLMLTKKEWRITALD